MIFSLLEQFLSGLALVPLDLPSSNLLSPCGTVRHFLHSFILCQAINIEVAALCFYGVDCDGFYGARNLCLLSDQLSTSTLPHTLPS